MNYFFKTYRVINILSVDVAVGAMIGALFFEKIFSVTICLNELIALGLSVWIIYTADHLIDAKKIKHQAATERHRFHQIHFKMLFIFLMVAIFINAIQLFFIRKMVFINGIALAIIIILYFAIQRNLRFSKELIGALLYSIGILLIPLSESKTQLLFPHFLLVTQFFLVAWINLLLFSWIDLQEDKHDQHFSFATAMGEKHTKKLIFTLLALQVIIFAIQLLFFDTTIQLIFFLMNIFLVIIILKKKYFKKDDRYRRLGDAVFFLPLIYFLLVK